MEKINELTSENIVKQNIERLKEIFPTAFSEGKLVVEELQALVGEYIQKDKEFYQMTWSGKTEAQREANKVSTGTLRPSKEESKDWDSIENIFIEGDNLEVLKLLQKSYSNKIKMIYIDPPYNTGKDFIYPDDFSDNLKNYLDLTGQTDEKGKKISANSESDGRFHSKWLTKMYSRLKLARNLMTNDGIIFISIDDNEQANLKKICDEIFGEENFVANLIWSNKEGGGSSDSKLFRIKHESIIVYSRDKNSVEILGDEISNLERYKSTDKHQETRGPYYLQKLGMGSIQYSESLDYEIIAPDGTTTTPKENNSNKKACWRWSYSKFKWGLENDFIVFKKDSNDIWIVYTKQYLNCDNEGNIIERTQRPFGVIDNFSSTQASKSLEKIGMGGYFNYSKPVDLLVYLLKKTNLKNSIVLDFFAGSGTTAHAVMQLNSEDYGGRKCISVQLPEPIQDENIVYPNIAELTKERMRRAGESIMLEKTDNENNGHLDVGFRVFKLDSSNILAWDTSVDEFEGQLDMFAENNGDHIKSNRTEEDVLFEILLKYGLELTLPIEEKMVGECKIYNIGFGSMYICLSDNIKSDIATTIGEWHKESSDTNPSVIFKDSGFDNDADKTNTVQTLRQAGIENVKSI